MGNQSVDLGYWTKHDFAIWIKGKDELLACREYLNRVYIKDEGRGIPIEDLERFKTLERNMRYPEFNDIIVDGQMAVIPRKFIRLVPVLRWPIVREMLDAGGYYE